MSILLKLQANTLNQVKSAKSHASKLEKTLKNGDWKQAEAHAFSLDADVRRIRGMIFAAQHQGKQHA